MKIVFMGTPEFAVPTLRQLCEIGSAPVAVYAQPARRKGRGLLVSQPPVAEVAEELGLPVRQPRVLQRPGERAFLKKLAPDLIITAAYGKIFRRRLLELPRLGCINLHPSLLPAYRGLSPINTAILRGDALTGVTVYRMTPGVDSGPILMQRTAPIERSDTCGTLSPRLAQLGAELVCEVVRALDAGQLAGQPQDENLASFAPRLEREDGRLDWRRPATQIEQIVRAYDPWPGTFTFLGARRVKILAVTALDNAPRPEPPGMLLSVGGKEPPIVAALPGAVALTRVQPENCKPQDGVAFCCGQRVSPGCRLTPWPAANGGAPA